MASILSLALETRNQIYQQLIVHQKPINQWHQALKPPDLHDAQQNYLALSRTSRQVEGEVRFIFYSGNIFSFNIQRKDSELGFLPAGDLTISQIFHCRISVQVCQTLEEDFNRYKLVDTICNWLSKAHRLRRLEIEYTSIQGEDEMEEQRKFIKFTGLGLLGPFQKLVNVDDFAIEGDVPPDYKKSLLKKKQDLRPLSPLPDMYHALRRYVTSFSMLHSPLMSYKFKDDFWQIRDALKYTDNMEEFKRHGRVVKKLGDLRGLDSSILYVHDLNDGTKR